MDRIDKKILHLLQQNSRLNNQDLAEMVSLSPSPCLRRVKQLEEAGYIKKYVALLDQEKIGLNLSIIVAVGLSNHDAKKMAKFEDSIRSLPEVVQCHLIAGGKDQDYLLKVVVPSLTEYQTFLLDKLTQIEGVKNVHSSFVLRSIVYKSSLPLDHL